MTQILLIDSSIQEYEEVVKSVNDNTMSIVYNKNYTFSDLSNAIAESIATGESIATTEGLSTAERFVRRIGIFCHDSAVHDTFYGDVSNMIDFIQHHAIEQIDFLACNTLNNPEWVKYYAQLPCIVGATNTYTGSVGGDWIMQSTGENIEFIYFEQINYKYLLSKPIATKDSNNDVDMLSGEDDSVPGSYTYNDIGQSFIGVKGNPYGSIVYPYKPGTLTVMMGNPLIAATATSEEIPKGTNMYININPDSNDPIANMATGLYPYYANGYVYIIYGIIDTPKLAYFKYNPDNYDTLNVETPGGYDSKSIFDIDVNFTQTTQFAFYNNYLYYSIKGPTPSIGRFLITSSSGSEPTFSDNNSSYINSLQLSSSKYPTGITCDNGNLYVIMGDTTTITATTGTDDIEILKFELDETPPKRSVLCKINAIKFGMPISLFFDNIDNIIYIGTYCGKYCEYSGTISIAQKGATKGVGMILSYYLDILKFYCYSTGVGSMFRINYDSTGDMLYIGSSNLALTGYVAARTTGPIASRHPAKLASSDVVLYKLSLFTKSNFNFYNPNIANQNNELFSMLDGPYSSRTASFSLNGNPFNANYNLKNKTIVSRFDTTYSNTNALITTSTYHGINTGFYVFKDNFYWDVMNFFTLSNSDTGIISPTVSTLSPIPNATGICCSSPHKISCTFTVNGNSSDNTNIGKYTIYGAGTYYLLINGILSPFYKTTIYPNTGDFVYTTGKNYIEIFTNGSVIASFNMPNINTITIGSTVTSGDTLYTSTLAGVWTKTAQSSYIKSDSNMGLPITSTDEKLFCLITGGLSAKFYNKNVDFTYTTSGSTSLNNIAYYYDIGSATSTSSTSLITQNRYIKNIYIDSTQFFLNPPTLTAGVTKWGYKMVGYFLPNKTGNWTFDLYADAGQFCIGSDNGVPTFINPNIGGSPQCFSMNETSLGYPSSPTPITMIMNYKTNDKYGSITSSTSVSSRVSVQLKSGIYYPILLYYGGGNKKLQLIFTDPNNTVYRPSTSTIPDSTYESFLYRVNIFPTY